MLKIKYTLLIRILLIPLLLQIKVIAQDTLEYKLNKEVIITGRRPISIANLNRSVLLINKEEINQMPVNAVQDLLQYSNSVDMRQRGINGTQADINIRGGTFEQTLILIDGIKIIDPQTGHYNLNLPFSLAGIERIEILKGEGSRIYGPNALSGAINFISGNDLIKRVGIGLEGGQNGYYSGSLNASYNAGNWGNNITAEKLKSDGYKENTDFDIINFFYNSTLSLSTGMIKLYLGINEKDVGANSFYSTRFPFQADYTKTKFLALGGDFGINQFFITPKIYWRRNNDEFVLDKYNPDFYKNIHETDFYGGEIQVSAESIIGITTLGGEYTKDRIESTNLGNHNRTNAGIFLEQTFNQFKKLNFTLSGFAYDYAMIGWKIWPGFDIGYQLTDEIRNYFSIGKAFRIPTYTELYYEDPVTSGNGELRHEESLNYEIGGLYKTNPVEISLVLFRKEGVNIIDYVKKTEEDKWEAMNISKTNTKGIEVGLMIKPDAYIRRLPVTKINLSYSFLDSDRNTEGYESRYVLDYLKHQLIINITNSFFYDIYFNWYLRYEKRMEFDDNFLTDITVSRKSGNFDFYIKATNLFNVYYEDIAGIQLPGRWIIGGFRSSLYL